MMLGLGGGGGGIKLAETNCKYRSRGISIFRTSRKLEPDVCFFLQYFTLDFSIYLSFQTNFRFPYRKIAILQKPTSPPIPMEELAFIRGMGQIVSEGAGMAHSPPINVARPGVICGLSLLLVLVLLREFFSWFSGFPPSTKTNISKFQFDQDREPS